MTPFIDIATKSGRYLTYENYSFIHLGGKFQDMYIWWEGFPESSYIYGLQVMTERW